MINLKVFFGVFLLIFAAQGIKINHPRVLLPIFDKISVNFTLEVREKGCFRWTSSRQDLILITALDNDADEVECAYRAQVTVLTREKRRNTAIVFAEDLATGQTLRCDVILDVIHKISVHTTTRQLYLEEAPAVFELRAEDSQGNEFTTLEGIEYKWTLSPLNGDSTSWLPPLRFLSFTDSEYHDVPPALMHFEANGKKGYMVLLEGIRTGTAKLSVSLPYREYRNVEQLDVYINVLANIIIEPSEVYILPGDTINFRIFQLHMGKLQEITSNKQYFLELKDDQVASLKGNAATGKKYGSTTVLLHDHNVPADDKNMQTSAAYLALPTAELFVVEPVKLGLSLLPYNNWITVVGEKHEIALDLYTRDEQKITLGSRYGMSASIDDSLFKVLKRSKNSSRLYGEAISEGITPVYGTYDDLAAQAELQIYANLNLKPSRVYLPYDPHNIAKSQKIQFHASGGDGTYSWYSLNPRVLHVNQSGMATSVVHTETHASFEIEDVPAAATTHAAIKVALTRNPHINRVARVYFMAPVKLQILKYNFETALRDYVHLHVALYTYVNNSMQPLTHCSNVQFEYELSQQIFQMETNAVKDVKPAAGACHVLHMRATAIGLAQLRLYYNYQDKQLHDEVTLNVFERLNILYPAQNELVLPIGASLNVVYNNGPQRIFTLESELVASMSYERKVATIQEVPTNAHLHVVNVLCREVGETNLEFSIYNSLNTDNFEAYISHITTLVRCVKPRFLNLYAMGKLRDSCPMEIKNSLLHMKESDNRFEVQIEVQDHKNRPLMNITSLHIDWEFIGNSGEDRVFNDAVNYERRVEEQLLHGIRIAGKTTLHTTLSKIVKDFRIKGVVSNYEQRVLQHYNIRPESPVFGIKNPKTGVDSTPIIENEISFLAVNSTKVFETDQLSIFMAQNAKERVRIVQGSGFYDIIVPEPAIVNVVYDAQNRELVVTPLRIGHTRIELIDQCIMAAPTFLSISVVSIGRLELYVPDRVERTKSIEAIVKLLDSNDNPLHVDHMNLHLYELSHMFSQADILTLKLADQSNLGLGEIRYIITGNKLGEAKIGFTCGSQSNNIVTSNTVNIQVFPPLRLYPRNSTLLIGSTVQISYQGGPQPDVNVVFEVEDKDVISMDSGIVTAQSFGLTRITGRCVITHPLHGNQIVISQDTVQINVVALTGIQVRTPLVRIRIGAVMPIAVWGTPDFSPMILGTIKNMRITWTTNRENVVEIFNIFASAGVEYQEEDMISARVKALNAGMTKITAHVELPTGEKFSSSVDVVVFKPLELVSPKHIDMDWILIAPRSTLQLKSNLDDVVYSKDKDSSGVVKVSTDGLVQTNDVLGRDLLIAKAFEQYLPIGIEVKNVKYILARLEAMPIKLKQSENKLPKGINFVLKVSLYDNQGNEFSQNIEDIKNGIRYELSHKDVVDVHVGTNFSIALNLPTVTSSMIAISLKDTTGIKHAEDYIKLSVAESEHIYPHKAIFVPGDIICFDSPLSSSSLWMSSNDKILTIDTNTGIARVLNGPTKSGEKVIVTNGDASSGTYIKYDVEVRDADVIQTFKSADTFSGIDYKAYVILRNHVQLDKITNLIGQNSSNCKTSLLYEQTSIKFFSCKLGSKHPLGAELLSHYKVAPIFDSNKGMYACQIELISNFNDLLAKVKTNEVLLNLQIQLFNGISNSISLKLVPGIKVTPDALSSVETSKQEFIVTGLDKVLQKVDVKSSNTDKVLVEQFAKSHGSLQYRINVINNLPADEELFIAVHSPLTLQEIQIPIVGGNAMQAECDASGGSFDIYRFLSNLGLAVSMGLILFITVWAYINWGADRAMEVNTAAFAQSTPQRNRTATMGMRNTSPLSTPSSAQTSGYQNISAFNRRSSPLYRMDNSQESQVYGDTTIISPQKRINRRYL